MEQLQIFFAGIVLGAAVGAALTAVLLVCVVPLIRKMFPDSESS